MANIRKFIFFTILLILWGCNTEEDIQSGCFPSSTVNVNIDLSLAAYQNLQQSGGWIYFEGALAGTRGLIIVNTGSGFKAYDRNAPHLCPGTNTTLQVESDVLIECSEDGAQWILTTGEPVQVASRAPVSYFTALNATVLTIYN